MTLRDKVQKRHKSPMQLSKAGYYADFFVYPVLLLPLAAEAILQDDWRALAAWMLACLAGIAACTLAEYVTHRVVLHHIPPFRGMHDMHHKKPIALIGTPTWLSAAFIGGAVLLPVWWQAGLNISSGLTFGFILGYLWYVLVHHAIHRWRARDGSYLQQAKRRHGQHHLSRQPCNFGVTTACWDVFFGTVRWR